MCRKPFGLFENCTIISCLFYSTVSMRNIEKIRKIVRNVLKCEILFVGNEYVQHNYGVFTISATSKYTSRIFRTHWSRNIKFEVKTIPLSHKINITTNGKEISCRDIPRGIDIVCNKALFLFQSINEILNMLPHK